MAKDGKKKSTAAAVAAAAARREACEADAEQFKALSDPTRLCILGFLRVRMLEAEASALSLPDLLPPADLTASANEEDEEEADDEEDEGEETAVPDGTATVGEIACYVYGTSQVPSNLSHHLKELRRAGLVTVKRKGKHLLCRLNRETVDSLAARLQSGMSSIVASVPREPEEISLPDPVVVPAG